MIPTYLKGWANSVWDIAESLGATLVVLGRDAWPIMAWLRSQGKPCQYFLCSRLQAESYDFSTRKQWLVEVPPGAFIVDTGFRGSIIEWIRGFDPTVTGGALMSACSGSSVPQVGEGERDSIVEDIEHLPKHHDRTVGYNADGCAFVNEGFDTDGALVDSDQAGFTGYLLLREMGLTAEQARQYAQFTGLTPEERIGVADHGLVREHMLQVKRLRRERESFCLQDFLRHGRPEEVERVTRVFAGKVWANRNQIRVAYNVAWERVNRCRAELKVTPSWDLDQLEEQYQRLLRWQRRLTVAHSLNWALTRAWHNETTDEESPW